MEKRRDSQALKALLGVRQLVLGGSVQPGQRLSEIGLSEQLEISRTPLRAALARLEQEGLLEPLPSGGYTVRAFTLADVIDAIELRGVLEGTAARLAAERGVAPERLKAIRDLVDELDTCFRDRPEDMLFDQYVELNTEFHAMLAGLAGSETMRREVERAMHLPFASPSAFLENQADVLAFRRSLTHAQRQHRDIVEAIAMREGARAEALGREHARLARKNLDFVVGEAPNLIGRVPGLSLIAT
ncbi:MAG: GntR family transcriptional regulator [Rhizobiaceae bacterium]|nr:GntR family transcriptional regulator [Rhizobiaceae bacterium]